MDAYILYTVQSSIPSRQDVSATPNQYSMRFLSKRACETAASILVPKPDKVEDGKRIVTFSVPTGERHFGDSVDQNFHHFVVCLPEGE